MRTCTCGVCCVVKTIRESVKKLEQCEREVLSLLQRVHLHPHSTPPPASAPGAAGAGGAGDSSSAAAFTHGAFCVLLARDTHYYATPGAGVA